MNAFESFVNALRGTMTVPKSYGWFHLMFVGIVIVSCVLLCMFFRNCNDKTFRRIALICWVLFIALEAYKQTVFSFGYDQVTDTVTWAYAWYVFPFQLCSTPIYILPFIFILKDGKLRDCFISFMSFFALFGGLAVFFYPNDVFTSLIGINIQTMVHHGMQIVLGVYFISYKRRSFSIMHYVKGVPVFASLCAIAIILNEILYATVLVNKPSDAFNMFYISRHYACTLPILSEVYKVVPYAAFCLIYVLGFAFVAFIIFLVSKLIVSLVGKAKAHAE